LLEIIAAFFAMVRFDGFSTMSQDRINSNRLGCPFLLALASGRVLTWRNNQPSGTL
jgi:hypothetical protein